MDEFTEAAMREELAEQGLDEISIDETILAAKDAEGPVTLRGPVIHCPFSAGHGNGAYGESDFD